MEDQMNKLAATFDGLSGYTSESVQSIGAKRVFNALKQNFNSDAIIKQLTAASGDPRILIQKLHNIYSTVLGVERRMSRIPQEDIDVLEMIVQHVETTLRTGADQIHTNPEFAKVFATLTPSYIVQTASVNKKSQKKSWTYLLQHASDSSKALDSLIEKQLGEVKKHDVVNVGRTEKEMTEIQEGQLEKERKGEIFEITEVQLKEARTEEELELTEAQIEENDLHRPEAGEGDDIKIYREVNRIQRQNAEANESYYNENKDEKTKGGVVSANTKKKIQK